MMISSSGIPSLFDDKYGYSSKRDGIPEDDKLPKVVVNLTTNEVVSHR